GKFERIKGLFRCARGIDCHERGLSRILVLLEPRLAVCAGTGVPAGSDARQGDPITVTPSEPANFSWGERRDGLVPRGRDFETLSGSDQPALRVPDIGAASGPDIERESLGAMRLRIAHLDHQGERLGGDIA